MQPGVEIRVVGVNAEQVDVEFVAAGKTVPAQLPATPEVLEALKDKNPERLQTALLRVSQGAGGLAPEGGGE